jgi:cell division septation protein DedD
MLIAALACAVSDAAAQAASSLTLRYEQVATRTIPGATAALSLDPSRVGASVQDGVVTLIGRGPGSTNVIVITAEETITLRVVVGEPPVNVLPGMRNSNARGGASGYYEARYGSDPGILQGNLFFSRRDGERSAELTLGGAAPLGDHVSSPFSIPQASFTLRTPGRELTLLDRSISHSPLTISRSNVRGLFLRQGPWQVNAGYSFFSTFEHLLLPTDKEAVAGVAYRHRLTPRSSLTPNLFYFDGPVQSRRGALGTLLYETRTAADVKFSAELGLSRSLGGALEVDFDRPDRRAWARVRMAPSDLPSLSTDQQSGRQLEGGWFWQGDKSTVSTSLSSRSYSHGAFDQTSSVASFDLQRRLTPHWAVHAGAGGSIFANGSQDASRIRSMTLPLGASFSGSHGGAGVDYQFSRETTRNLGGHLFRVNLNGSAGGFRLSGFGERQTQAPTARQIFTEVRWLQPMLDRLGLAANTPQQLADLLRTNAELSAYGYANSIRIDVTPVRTRLGGTVGWSGSGARRPQFSASTLLNRDESVDRTSMGAVHSMSYSQKLDGATEVFLTWSALCHDRYVSSACKPVMFASLRRALSTGPRFLAPPGGRIDGVVFKDDKALGVYASDLPPLSGVEVILDNRHHTRTDDAGRFRFENVPYGPHRVEARYTSDQPTFFTTPSPADVETGSSVHFGVAWSRSSLRGVVLADAGAGINGVLVHVVNADRRTTARTADDGRFVVEGLAPGDYDVTIDAASVPAGYPVDNLAAQRVRVEKAEPGRARFVLRPYRSVAGRARVFDRISGQYIALAGATVELLPLGQKSVTDARGQYAFRNLPAGRFTIVAKQAGRENSAAVSLPEGPAIVKDVELIVLPAGEAAAGDSSPLAGDIDQLLASLQADGPRVHEEGQSSATAAGSAATSGVFTIAVAESSSARHARAMVDELKGAGHAAYLETATSQPNSPYRVRVGHYSTLAEATRSARSLEKALGWRMSVINGWRRD